MTHLIIIITKETNIEGNNLLRKLKLYLLVFKKMNYPIFNEETVYYDRGHSPREDLLSNRTRQSERPDPPQPGHHDQELLTTTGVSSENN